MEHGGGPHWALALEQSAFGHVLRESLFLYPLANVLHVLAVATLLGSILVFDLRVLGFGRGVAVDALAKLAIPVAAGALCVAVPTGAAMFITEAPAYVRNPVFLVKIALILLAALNVAVFHFGPLRDTRRFAAEPRPLARASASASLGLWLAAVTAGRLIAYY
jgi:Family of unknown function (DUF6644)